MDEIMCSIINESLNESISSIFDIRNEKCVEEAIEFVTTLSSLTGVTSPLFTSIRNYLSDELEKIDDIIDNDEDEEKIINMKNNMKDSFISNQPISEVEAFSTLYDKGYIEDSYMQKHIARINQELKSTFSNLMGGKWNGVSKDDNPLTPIQISVNDWIDADMIVGLNNIICEGKIFDTSVFDIKSLIRKLLVDPKGFDTSSIFGDTYMDMNTNAFMCVNFASLAFLITELESDENNLKRVENTMNRLKLFGYNKGVNDFFTCSCMVLNVSYCTLSKGMGNSEHLKKSCQFARIFSEWYDGYKVSLPNKQFFPQELSRLLKSLQMEYGFGLTKEDLKELHIPVPVLMPDMVDGEDEDERQSGMILEESVKIGQSLQKCICDFDTSYDDTAVGIHPLDSLVEGFQVESEGGNTDSDVKMSVVELHKVIVENSNRLFHNASRHNNDALKSNLAMNLLLTERANFILESDGNGLEMSNPEKILIVKDLTQMEYQNNRYIGIVEACSNESVHEYANSNRDTLLKEMIDMVKRV